MNGRSFFDTNVLLYLLSADATRADRAEELLARGGIVSVQVLNEFAAVCIRKLGMSWVEAADVLDTIRALCSIESLTIETHDRGKALAMRYGFSVYDAMIVAAALIAGADTLYSEDLQDGMRVDGSIIVRNPFQPQ
ncbi:MAG: PIN domain-containing protein [Gammaproteobacteria bacterium]|nr:PIN domain-containing protein [Gammaproteobacteria bacterium]